MTEQDLDLIRALLCISLMQLRVLQRDHPTPEREQDIRQHEGALYRLERAALAA